MQSLDDRFSTACLQQMSQQVLLYSIVVDHLRVPGDDGNPSSVTVASDFFDSDELGLPGRAVSESADEVVSISGDMVEVDTYDLPKEA